MAVIILTVLLIMLWVLYFCIKKYEIPKYKGKKNKDNILLLTEDIYVPRLKWSVGFANFAFLLFFISFLIKVYLPYSVSKLLIFKLAFAYASSYLGFSIYIFTARFHPYRYPFPSYIIKYPLILFAFSSLSLLFLNTYLGDKTCEDFLFYLSLFSINVLLAFFTDTFPKSKT